MSVYDEELNALFIHVPRTGGTSMEYALFPDTGGHETIRHWEKVNDVFKFAFVRNPWDRFVSAFFCHPKNTSAKFLDGFSMDRDGFNQYIEFCSREFSGEYPVYSVHKMHFAPMWFFLLADNNKIGVDFVGRFESLQDDWNYVCDTLGVSIELAHERKFDHPRYDRCYTAENWNYVGQLYEKDIQLFGYG